MSKPFISIEKKLRKQMLHLSLSALIILGSIWMVSLLLLSANVLGTHEELSNAASNTSQQAILKQLEQNLAGRVFSQADLANERFSAYLELSRQLAAYTADLYSSELDYPDQQILPPDPTLAGTFTLQLIPARFGEIPESDLKELSLMANLQALWEPIMQSYQETIGSIYFATVSGYMVNYDERSDLSSITYDFFDASWYQQAIAAGQPIVTESYPDSFGRGLMITTACPVYVQGELKGVTAIDILTEDLNEKILAIQVSDHSSAFLVENNGTIISYQGMEDPGSSIIEITSPFYDISDEVLSGAQGIVQGRDQIYYGYAPIPAVGWHLVVSTPAGDIIEPSNEITQSIEQSADKTRSLIQTSLLVSLFFFLLGLSVVLYILLSGSKKMSKTITLPLQKLKKDVDVISSGDLDHQAEIISNDETGALAQAFNEMSSSLKEHISRLVKLSSEKERIQTELDIASQIQNSMLPNLFPAFPERKEFDLYAVMHPAREVGGDFYDFFMLDEDHLAVVIADVSGKGIPAALFMVVGKTLIKDHSSSDRNLENVFSEVNDLLAEGNENGMFITAFEGVLNIKSGEFVYVNAGHNPPLLQRDNGLFEPVTQKADLILGVFENVPYHTGKVQLHRGDRLFLYTDGISEAANEQMILFGLKRLQQVLNENSQDSSKQLIEAVSKAVDDFRQDAEQFDDMTMLSLRYFGEILEESNAFKKETGNSKES